MRVIFREKDKPKACRDCALLIDLSGPEDDCTVCGGMDWLDKVLLDDLNTVPAWCPIITYSDKYFCSDCETDMRREDEMPNWENELVKKKDVIAAIRGDIMGGLNYESIVRDMPGLRISMEQEGTKEEKDG